MAKGPHQYPKVRAMYPGCLRAKIVSFVQANPDEELSLNDISTKFEVKRWAAADAVRYAVKAGQVRIERRKRAKGRGPDEVFVMGVAE